MNLREAAQQALDALEVWQDSLTDPSAIPGWRFSIVGEGAITALRAALAEDRSSDVGETSDHFPDATKMVEPVAYITGYFNGKCVIKPVEHVVFPAGMALYRLPPTSQESRQVEPVAWMRPDRGHICFHKHSAYVPLYLAPPKRNPLTDWEIEVWAQKPISRIALCRAIERAHGIGGEE